MSTDFTYNRTTITSSGGFAPSSVDTPLDIRYRVELESDILSIPNPYVGMLVYTKDTGKLYVVKTLRSKTVGLDVVENAAVDTYEELSTSADLDGYTTNEYVDGELAKKVDKVDGKSLVDDAIIAKLEALDGYTTNEYVDGELAKKVDKVDGKSLVDDAIIAKLEALGIPTTGDLATKTDIETAMDGMTIEVLTTAEYEALGDTAKNDPKKLYILSDAENTVVDLSSYATKEYVDQQVASGGNVNMDEYVTDVELNTRLDNMSIDVLTQAEYDALPDSAKNDTTKLYIINDAEDVTIDLSNYATLVYVDQKIAEVATGGTVDLSSYVTDSELNTRLDGMTLDVLTQAEYDALPDSAKNDTTKLYMLSDVEPTVDLSNYATLVYVDQKIAEVTTGGTVDLSSYVTDNELDTRLDNMSIDVLTQAEYDALPDSAKNDTTKLYIINDAEDVTIDLSNYATKTELDTRLDGVSLDILTQAEYDALPDSAKNDDKLYIISDSVNTASVNAMSVDDVPLTLNDLRNNLKLVKEENFVKLMYGTEEISKIDI